jgi:hypothetical protein
VARLGALGRDRGCRGSQCGFPELHVTRSVLDLKDQVLQVYDARNLAFATWTFAYDLAGRRTSAAQATGTGSRWSLSDAAGNPRHLSMNRKSMNEEQLSANLQSLVESFRNTAHRALDRIGRSLGVECSEGHYDHVVSAARTARSGVVNDGGRLEYRFHGSGCEARTESCVVDFNIYPKLGGVSHIMAGPFGFKKYVCSVGIETDEETVLRVLDEAADRGLIERLETGRSYYSFSPMSR